MTAIAVAVLSIAPLFAQNYSLSYNGSGEHTDCGNHSSLDVTNLSVEVWIKASTGTFAYSNVIDKSHDGTSNEGWALEFDASGEKLNFYYMNGSTTGVVTTSTSLDDDTWHHVAATYDGSIARIYVDGTKEDSSTTVTGNLASTTGNLYFASWKGTGRWFPGQIDEVRIWDNALTSAMITAYKDIEVTASHPNRVGTDHLVAYYQMSDGSGTSLSDNSANSNTGSLNGGMGNSNWIEDSPLPLELLYFAAECSGDDAVLSWATASEYNVRSFELLFSKDGREFTFFAMVDAVGFSLHEEQYRYTVKSAVAMGACYYQLREIDFDGTQKDLAYVYLNCASDWEDRISLYPNPVTDRLYIDLGETPEKAEVQVLDARGYVLHRQNVYAECTTVHFDDFPSGLYILNVVNKGKEMRRKFFVQ